MGPLTARSTPRSAGCPSAPAQASTATLRATGQVRPMRMASRTPFEVASVTARIVTAEPTQALK